MRPGKQSLFFSTLNKKSKCHEVAVQTCIINVRMERVPFFRKESSLKRAQIVKQFQKDKSIFAAWKDNNKILTDHDYQMWKLPRFVKKEADQADVRRFMNEHLEDFKEFYANAQAISNLFPGISSPAFAEFCQQSKLIDK